MVTFVNIKGSGWSGKIHSHCSGSPDSKQGNEITIRRLLLSFSVPEDQEESRLIGLEVLMAPLGRPRFAVLYLRGPISNPRILEQRYDTFFVMMLFYIDLSPKKQTKKQVKSQLDSYFCPSVYRRIRKNQGSLVWKS